MARIMLQPKLTTNMKSTVHGSSQGGAPAATSYPLSISSPSSTDKDNVPSMSSSVTTSVAASTCNTPSSSATPSPMLSFLSPFHQSPESTPATSPLPCPAELVKMPHETPKALPPVTGSVFAIGKEVTTDTKSLFRQSASQVLSQIRKGEVTVEDWAMSLLDRIDDRDEQVMAWEYLDRERVLSEARRLDAVPRHQRGRLHGMPVAVKDVITTKDMPTKHASPLYSNSHSNDVDAGSVAILREAGCLIFGKTTTTEFATAASHGPKTRNPHSLPPLFPARTPGGSSSGSGASVGDCQIPIALGTQTGGSTIRPASFNGIYGLKPTWGAISREGQKFYSVSLDTLGIYARDVDDLDMMLEELGVWDDEQDPTLADQRESMTSGRLAVNPSIEFPTGLEEVAGKKFAVCKTMVWPYAGPGTRAALTRAVNLLRAHGAIVEEIHLPESFDMLPEWHRIILHAEGRSTFYPEFRKAASAGPDLLHDHVVGHVQNVHKFTRRQHLDAEDGVARLRPWMDDILSGYAALLTPSAPDEAPLGTESTGSAVFCSNWTTLHNPVINIPGFKGENDMPVGISLVAPRFRDRHLLRVSKAVGQIFEAEGGWERNV